MHMYLLIYCTCVCICTFLSIVHVHVYVPSYLFYMCMFMYLLIYCTCVCICTLVSSVHVHVYVPSYLLYMCMYICTLLSIVHVYVQYKQRIVCLYSPIGRALECEASVLRSIHSSGELREPTTCSDPVGIVNRGVSYSRISGFGICGAARSLYQGS